MTPVLPNDGGRSRGVGGLVLAAGAGRRFGRAKALVTLNGEPLVERCARVLTQSGCAPVFVVLGAHAEEVTRDANLSEVWVVHAADWAEGIGTSLRRGLAALDGTSLDAVVVALVDQPLVGAEAVRRLCAAHRSGAVAAVATYHGQPRNPVLLARPIWAEVAEQARGDIGARAWLRDNPDQVVMVPCDDTGSPSDVDTHEDLVRISAIAAARLCQPPRKDSRPPPLQGARRGTDPPRSPLSK